VTRSALEPDPATYRLAAELLQELSEHLLAVEDAVSSVKSAMAAGMWCLGARSRGVPFCSRLRADHPVIPDFRSFSLSQLGAHFSLTVEKNVDCIRTEVGPRPRDCHFSARRCLFGRHSSSILGPQAQAPARQNSPLPLLANRDTNSCISARVGRRRTDTSVPHSSFHFSADQHPWTRRLVELSQINLVCYPAVTTPV
jgi:hypothetical protein